MLIWHDKAWADYLYWQGQDKKTLKRINQILKDIQRSPFEGIGKPEPLKGSLYWSRRIDDFNRIVYRIEGQSPRPARGRGLQFIHEVLTSCESMLLRCAFIETHTHGTVCL